jgi:CheY-like chemotaxis protein
LAKLLIVDDEEDLLEALSQILEEEGYEIQMASSSEVALELLEADSTYKPDLILADMVMPGITGLQLMQVLRERPDYADIPFLFISATSTEEMEKRLRKMENARFLRKPFQIDELCMTVAEMLM